MTTNFLDLEKLVHHYGIYIFNIRYQVPGSGNTHIFYSGIDSATSRELFRIAGFGGFIATQNVNNTNSQITCASGGGLQLTSTHAGGPYNTELVQAANATQYSANALDGDFVLRATTRQLHIQSGTGASALSIATNNQITIRQPLTCLNTVSATPQWGNGYLASDQIIPLLSNGLITWTSITAGPLTRTSTRFTYTGATNIFVQVSFTANWKALGATFFSGVWISVRKNGTDLYNVTKTIVDSIRVVSTSSTTIIPLSTNDYFEILATNLETLDTTIIGAPFLTSDCAVMSYYILN
jgi:hypothetical protein